MSEYDKKVAKLNRKFREQREQKQSLVEFASQAVRFWYRANERVKKIHATNIQDLIAIISDTEAGRKTTIEWIATCPIQWIRFTMIWILTHFHKKPMRAEIAVQSYRHEYHKWQIEAIMGGQVKLTPAQIGVVIGINEDKVRSLTQELIKEVEEFEKMTTEELAKRTKASNPYA